MLIVPNSPRVAHSRIFPAQIGRGFPPMYYGCQSKKSNFKVDSHILFHIALNFSVSGFTVIIPFRFYRGKGSKTASRRFFHVFFLFSQGFLFLKSREITGSAFKNRPPPKLENFPRSYPFAPFP